MGCHWENYVMGQMAERFGFVEVLSYVSVVRLILMKTVVVDGRKEVTGLLKQAPLFRQETGTIELVITVE